MGLFDWLKPKKCEKGKVAPAAGKVEKEMVEIGRITHFFPHPSAAVIELAGDLKVGDKIAVKGHSTDFEQVVKSMQINNVDIPEAEKGKVIGIKVKKRVRANDIVYKL